jgi:predicted methyltransferase
MPISRLSVVFALPLLAACGSSASNAPPATSATSSAAPAPLDAKIKASLAGPQRTPKEVARDAYRHPAETLAFFGLKDDMNVVELSPGGGWYTAVLAPVLRDTGHLAIVGGDPNGPPDSESTKNAKELAERFAKSPQAFDKVEVRIVHPKQELSFGPPESADMVVTFRNFHNWAEDGSEGKLLEAVFKVLKHGGVLGLTDHRANAGGSTDPKTIGNTGYIPEAAVIAAAEKAGFKLAGKSDVNANAKDTKDYPKGVWTLPPTYELGAQDHAKYEAIGESDRMTLKLVKP